MKPDLVIVYGTQTELRRGLDRASIPYYTYEHRAMPDIMATIRSIGARIGSAAQANALAASMEQALAGVRSTVAGRRRPRTLLVFERDRSSLRNIYASGGYGFLADLLEAAGGDNIFSDLKQQSVQASTEMILARRPDVIIELRYGQSAKDSNSPRDLRAWDALGSVPAVKDKRITFSSAINTSSRDLASSARRANWGGCFTRRLAGDGESGHLVIWSSGHR